MTAPGPVTLRAVPLHPRLAAGAPRATTHVLVRTRASTERTGPRPRLTVVLVIDVSGSMEGEPLAQVIRSAQSLADILSDTDSLGVVAFENEARTVIEPRPLDATARAAVKLAVAGLTAGGGTNMSAGISRGALLLPPRAPDERQLLLLLTDGQANVGVFSKDGLRREVALVRGREVACSMLGYGPAHNEDLLVDLANAGGGRYAFVSDPLLARSTFVRALGSQLDVVAEDVRVLATPDAGVEIVRVLGDPPTSFGANGLSIKLQDPIAGEEASLVLELAIETPPLEGGRERPHVLLELTLAGKVVGTGERFESGALATVTLSTVTGTPEPEAASLVAIALADELREQARGHGDRRDFGGAVEVLGRAIRILEAAPPSAAVKDAIEALRDDVAAFESVPSAAEYETYKKAQRQEFDFSAGSKPFTNRVALTEGTVVLTQRIHADVPEARLVVVADAEGVPAGLRFQLGHEVTIGRSPDAEIPIPAGSISRRHARVVYDDDGFWLFDLGSSNATIVNGRRVQRHRLGHGDVVALGAVKLRFELKP